MRGQVSDMFYTCLRGQKPSNNQTCQAFAHTTSASLNNDTDRLTDTLTLSMCLIDITAAGYV